MESHESLILNEIIKPGKEFFDDFLKQQVNNKKLDKRKRTNKLQQSKRLDNTKQSYSVFNLVKTGQPKLSITSILAGQLLKTNVLNQRRSVDKKDEEQIKFYQDYQQTQKINKKFTKIFIKPIKTMTIEQINKEEKSVSFQQTFNFKSKQLIEEMNTSIMAKIEEKYHPKPKLITTKNMLDQSDHKMLYFASDAKDLLKKVQFQTQVNNFTLTFFNQSLESLKIQLQPLTNISLRNCQNLQLLQKFNQIFQISLPYYLQRQYHQNFSTIHWKSGLLQKQIQRSKYPLITGKVLYKYEHNLIFLKENQIKFKVFQYGTKRYDKLKQFIEERMSEKRIKNMRKQKQVFKQKQQKQDRNQFFSKQQIIVREMIPSNNQQLFFQVDSDNSKQKDFVSKNLISKNFGGTKLNQPKIIHPDNLTQKNPIQNQNGYNYRSMNSIISINIRSNPPPSGENFNQFNFDQFRFSKNSKFVQYQNQTLHEDKRKNSTVPRNIYMFNNDEQTNHFSNEQNQGQFRKKDGRFNEQSFDKGLFYQGQTYPNRQNNRSKSLQSPSDSNSSDCWNQIRKYQEGKTTKKKKSFMAIKPPRTSENNFMKVFQPQNIKLKSKKNTQISFYPLKLGNLILEQTQKAYLEYNCQKQQLKNLPMKFLLDRKKHGINKVQIIIPSLKQPNYMKINKKDQQRAKQIIKILLSLGGQISKIKPYSGYNEQSRKGHLKVSTQLQIYKFQYQDLSYFDIIDSLNIEKDWLQRELQNTNINGWKY